MFSGTIKQNKNLDIFAEEEYRFALNDKESINDVLKDIHCVSRYSSPYSNQMRENAGKMHASITPNTEYLSEVSPNAGKCGKNARHNNSEYGHFLRSDF